MNLSELIAEAASAPMTRTIRNRALDTVIQREGDDPTWVVKTKNIELIYALNEACGQYRGVELVRKHELGVTKAAEYEVTDTMLATLIHEATQALDDPEPPAAA
jgi:hypothetical protein